jgi:hypothetical protein
MKVYWGSVTGDIVMVCEEQLRLSHLNFNFIYFLSLSLSSFRPPLLSFGIGSLTGEQDRQMDGAIENKGNWR